MLEEIGKLIDKYLDNHSDWKRIQTDFCERQGHEVVWRNEKKEYSIIHSQNYKTPGYMSCHAPKHIWRIGGSLGKNDNWSLCFTYGTVPF